jgi:hypothetical protein
LDEIYRRLREKLDRVPIGFPEGRGAIEILKNLFTPEEAELALKLPMITKSLEEIAAELNEDPATLREKLDGMASRGTVLAVEKEGKKLYNTLARKPPTSVVGMNRQKSLFESRVHK